MSQSKFVLWGGTKVLHYTTLVTLLGGGEGEGCWPSMYRMQCLWWKRGSLGYTFPEMTVPQVHRWGGRHTSMRPSLHQSVPWVVSCLVTGQIQRYKKKTRATVMATCMLQWRTMGENVLQWLMYLWNFNKKLLKHPKHQLPATYSNTFKSKT